jgi:Caspase recruitment domain
MANAREKLKQLVNDNGDLCVVVRTRTELLELFYNEWSHLLVQNVSSLTDVETFEQARSGLMELNTELRNVNRNISQIFQRIRNAMSHCSVNQSAPVLARVERQLTAQTNTLNSELDLLTGVFPFTPASSPVVGSGLDVPEHKRLRQHYDWFTHQLDALSVASELFQCHAITEEQLESIQVNQDQSSKVLLDIILHVPPWVFDAFMQALINTDQDDVYLKLSCTGEPKFS